MKQRITWLLIFVLFFITGCNNNNKDAESKNEAGLINSETNETNLHPNDSVKLFIDQEINYYAPQSGSVFLVWKSKNYLLEESVLWNENTKLNDGLLYSEMMAYNDTFRIKLKVPSGSVLEYYFWITKNKQGQYLDFWDLKSSDKITVDETIPINKTAVYTKSEESKVSLMLTKGWLLFLILSGILAFLILIQKTLISDIKKFSIIQKVIITGVSLAVFQILARAEIINVNILAALFHPGWMAKILRGSLYDFIYVAGLVAVFVLILLGLKHTRIRKLIYGIFLFLVFFSTLAAFINISTVIYLGKPFTYQWLYYSDFLGSDEAKTALQENLSPVIVLSLISICISVFLFTGILQIIFRILTLRENVKYISFSLFALALFVLSVFTYRAKITWTKGQALNAITSMLGSAITANSHSSFFAAKIPDDAVSFDPALSVKTESLYDTAKSNNIKNVLFIILESAGAVYFDDYGGKFQLSPNLNKYASQSLIFDNMYAHAPATNRSLVSILGAMYPYLSYKSLTQEAPGIDHPTLSSELKKKGYRTSFFSSADLRFQNCRNFLNQHEFDVIEDFSAIKCVDEFELITDKEMEGNGIDDLCLSDRLTTWLDEDTTQNFFSMIWTVQGHYPYFFKGKEYDFGVSDVNFNRYLNCLKHNDELVGKIMLELEIRGLASSTLVVVVGDHGEAFGQHKQYGHGTALYEENIKVPLYFINSTLFNGERKSDIAGMKDIATTTLAIMGADIPEKWQGRNLLNSNSEETFYFAPWSDYLFGYRKNNRKFIFNETQNTVEVYDLNVDPGEKINLLQSTTKEELENARTRVAAWVQFQNRFVKELLEK